jgi:hypothetical protein
MGPWHDSSVILLIIGAAIVLVLMLLRVADGHDERRSRAPRKRQDD